MPDYPFVRMPTFGDFIRIAEEHGCTYSVNRLTMVGPDGSSQLSVFRRTTTERHYEAPAPKLSNDDRMSPHLLQSLCVRLDLPLDAFGLTLTDEGFEPV